MRVLFVMKRFSSGKDMILDDFGRQMRIADQLVRQGMHVTLLCLDYRTHQNFEKTIGKKRCISASFLRFLSLLRKEGRAHDIIIGATDPLFGVSGKIAAGKKPFVYDIQDNYEAYATSKIPLLRFFEKKVMKKAALIICWSSVMEKMVRKVNSKTLLLPNGVDLSLCTVSDRKKARKAFGIPEKKKVIFYSGTYDIESRTRGLDVLLRAFAELEKKRKDIVLFIVGRGNAARVAKENTKNIIVKDAMPYDQLMLAQSTADAFVLPYTHSNFTKFTMTPYKLPEYMAFNRPVVCSDVGEMRKVLTKTPQLLFNPENAGALAQKMDTALSMGTVDYSKDVKKLEWAALAQPLIKKLEALA